MAWIIAAVLVVALIVCALEWVSRAYARKRLGTDLRVTQAVRDRFSAWTNNPTFMRADIQHNAQGFRRTGNVSAHKPRKSHRIFLLGGSAAYGAQGGFTHIDNRWSRIRNDQLVDSFLEHRLKADRSQPDTEVINAAVSGYRLHQQLALIQSRIIRYQPDQVILMDGYNDFISLYNWIRSGCRSEFDVYENTPGGEDFQALANPAGLYSLAVFGKAWLRASSSLFSIALQRMPGQVSNPWAAVTKSEKRTLTRVVHSGDLTGEERLAVAAALANIGYYADIARQIHRVLGVYGIRPLFLLQPILILSGKPLTDTEQKFLEYEWQTGGSLYFYLFREIYVQIDRAMSEAAQQEGFLYRNLVSVFDDIAEQTFSDFAHLTPLGNQVIANKLVAEAFCGTAS